MIINGVYGEYHAFTSSAYDYIVHQGEITHFGVVEINGCIGRQIKRIEEDSIEVHK